MFSYLVVIMHLSRGSVYLYGIRGDSAYESGGDARRLA